MEIFGNFPLRGGGVPPLSAKVFFGKMKVVFESFPKFIRYLYAYKHSLEEKKNC